MHNFLVCAFKFQDFASSQNYFARSQGRETLTFRNSAPSPHPVRKSIKQKATTCFLVRIQAFTKTINTDKQTSTLEVLKKYY